MFLQGRQSALTILQGSNFHTDSLEARTILGLGSDCQGRKWTDLLFCFEGLVDNSFR